MGELSYQEELQNWMQGEEGESQIVSLAETSATLVLAGEYVLVSRREESRCLVSLKKGGRVRNGLTLLPTLHVEEHNLRLGNSSAMGATTVEWQWTILFWAQSLCGAQRKGD